MPKRWKPEYGGRNERTTNKARDENWKPSFWKSFVSFFSRIQDEPSPDLNFSEQHLQNFVVVDLGGEIEFTTDGFHIWVDDRDEHVLCRYLDSASVYYIVESAYPRDARSGCCYVHGSF